MKSQHKTWFSKTAIPLSGLLVLVFYLSEAFSKFSVFFYGEQPGLQRVVKLAIMFFLAVALLKKNRRLLLLPVLLVIGFALGQIFLPNSFQPEVVVNMGKYLFPIFLFSYFTVYPESPKNRDFFFSTFEIIILVNSLLVLLGFTFDIELFATYDNPRFGYSGLFLASATGSYIYMLSLFYFLFTLKEQFFKNWKVWVVLAAVLLVGTKALYAAFFSVVLIWVIFFASLSKKQKTAFFSAVVLILLSALYFFFFEFGIFNEIRQERGLVDALFSFRNDLLFNRVLPFVKQNWSCGNYLFGGISDLGTQSQMDIVDIFYMWGILGGLGYLFVYYKSYFDFRISKPALLGLAVIFGIACFAGHFFVNASVVIYLLLLREGLKTYNT